MLDLNLNLKISDTKLTDNSAQKNFNISFDAFSKILESAGKSFSASESFLNQISSQKYTNKEEPYFIKSFEKDKKEDEKSFLDKEKDDEEKDKEKDINKVNITLEQILANYKNELGNEATNGTNYKNELGNEATNETNTKINEKFLPKNLFNFEALTAKKTAAKIDVQQILEAKNSNNVAVRTEALQALENMAKENINNLSNILKEVNVDSKIEITAVKFKETANNPNKSFNFNSSFNNLSSHLTKLSLNQSVDFSKTMNEKMTQESQILNQVKDATKTLGKGTSSVSMILRPESLGKVSVNLTSHNGSVSAQFIAQNQQTADTISKNLEMLKQNLIDQGLKVNDIVVKVQETTQSDNFMDNTAFNDDKLNEFKENGSNKNSHQSHNTNTKENEISYYETNEDIPEEENNSTGIIRENKNLEIYNNMGRKL